MSVAKDSIFGISIHALREEGDRLHHLCRKARGISIHALREEGDPKSGNALSIGRTFLSTPSARRATQRKLLRRVAVRISIHALREEGDAPHSPSSRPRSYFYPRPPRGGRPWSYLTTTKVLYFYPRPPRGGRPVTAPATAPAPSISIHALREEGDPDTAVPFSGFCNFYPRPPRGGRLGYHAGAAG